MNNTAALAGSRQPQATTNNAMHKRRVSQSPEGQPQAKRQRLLSEQPPTILSVTNITLPIILSHLTASELSEVETVAKDWYSAATLLKKRAVLEDRCRLFREQLAEGDQPFEEVEASESKLFEQKYRTLKEKVTNPSARRLLRHAFCIYENFSPLSFQGYAHSNIKPPAWCGVKYLEKAFNIAEANVDSGKGPWHIDLAKAVFKLTYSVLSDHTTVIKGASENVCITIRDCQLSTLGKSFSLSELFLPENMAVEKFQLLGDQIKSICKPLWKSKSRVVALATANVFEMTFYRPYQAFGRKNYWPTIGEAIVDENHMTKWDKSRANFVLSHPYSYVFEEALKNSLTIEQIVELVVILPKKERVSAAYALLYTLMRLMAKPKELEKELPLERLKAFAEWHFSVGDYFALFQAMVDVERMRESELAAIKDGYVSLALPLLFKSILQALNQEFHEDIPLPAKKMVMTVYFEELLQLASRDQSEKISRAIARRASREIYNFIVASREGSLKRCKHTLQLLDVLPLSSTILMQLGRSLVKRFISQFHKPNCEGAWKLAIVLAGKVHMKGFNLGTLTIELTKLWLKNDPERFKCEIFNSSEAFQGYQELLARLVAEDPNRVRRSLATLILNNRIDRQLLGWAWRLINDLLIRKNAAAQKNNPLVKLEEQKPRLADDSDDDEMTISDSDSHEDDFWL